MSNNPEFVTLVSVRSRTEIGSNTNHGLYKYSSI